MQTIDYNDFLTLHMLFFYSGTFDFQGQAVLWPSLRDWAIKKRENCRSLTVLVDNNKIVWTQKKKKQKKNKLTWQIWIACHGALGVPILCVPEKGGPNESFSYKFCFEEG